MKLPYRRHRLASVLAIITLPVLVAVGDARADITITIEQVGNEVDVIGQGSIDLTGLTKLPTPPVTVAEMTPLNAIVHMGPTTDTARNLYSGISGPASFGSGTHIDATSGTGDTIDINGFHILPTLAVPVGYMSGTFLSSTDTYSNATFISLGLTPGSYTYTWGTGGLDHTLTVQIGPSVAVPEPSTALVAAIGAVAFIAYGWSRHRREQRRQAAA